LHPEKSFTLGKDITHNQIKDGIDRRGFLECMAWAGTGVVWTLSGGIPGSRAFAADMSSAKGELHFVQISDTHLRFLKAANPDVAATLRAAVQKIDALSGAPDFLIHTGDLSHDSKAEQFDALDQILKESCRSAWRRSPSGARSSPT